MNSNFNDLTLTCIDNIQNAIKNNKLVLFVGAGISANSGAPTWNQLIVEMAKELGIKKEKFNPDEFLKIPQYYFNEYGESVYKNKIEQIFNVNLTSNPINELIFDLKPAYVITTNYDNLLEQVAPASYSVIRKNNEMPYAKTLKSIIKMHGDFNTDNIVLKEDDYLNYSNNFKLIETFIKSIIATHTVLFVGYSVNDYNVSLIFQWVKEVLGKDHQPAYLLDVNNNESNALNPRLIYDYYKKKNIYQLCYSQIKDNIDDFWRKEPKIKNKIDKKMEETKCPLRGSMGKATYELLSFIKYYYCENKIIEHFYRKLSLLKNLNYCFNFDIQNLLSDSSNKYYVSNLRSTIDYYQLSSKDTKFELLIKEIKNKLIYILPGSLIVKYLSESDLLEKEEQEIAAQILNNQVLSEQESKQIEELKFKIYNKIPTSTQEVDKLKFIYKILESKSIALLIHTPSKTKIDLNSFFQKTELEESDNKAVNFVYDFNYFELNNYINNCDYLPNPDSSINIFEKAYIKYKLLKYEQSYNELKNIANLSKTHYFIYSMAEFNKKNLEEPISFKRWNYRNQNTNNLDEILNQILEINIKEIFDEYSFQPYKDLLEDKLNFSYLNETASSINKHIITIQNTKDNVERGGCSFNPALNEFLVKILDIFNFINLNFLLIDHKEQVKTLYYLFIDSILKSYSIQNNNPENLLSGCSKIEQFNYFILYIMIEYIEPKELINLLLRYNIQNLKLEYCKERNINVKNDLLQSFKNLCDSMIKLKINDEKFWYKINNFLIIFSKTDLSKDEFDIILNSIKVLYKNLGAWTERKDSNKIFVYLKYFISNHYKNETTLNLETLTALLEFILIETQNYSDWDMQLLDLYPLFERFAFIIKHYNFKYILKDSCIFHNLLVPLHSQEVLVTKWNCIVVPLFELLNKSDKKNAKILLKDFFESYFQFDLYYNSCINNIIKSDPQLEVYVRESLDSLIAQNKAEPNLVNCLRDLVNHFNMTANLLINKKFKKINLFSPYNHKYSAFFDFVVNMDEFDYENKFDVEFLISLNSDYVNKFKSIIKNDSKLNLCVKNKFLDYLDLNNGKKYKHLYSIYQGLFFE